MSKTERPRDNSGDQAQVQQWLAEAEQAVKAGEWERSIELYRKALDFDRALEGVEAKLQYALRMRDIDSNYQQGKSLLQAGEYNQALGFLRKARLMYASRYKDTDELIVQAQSALQKAKWNERPSARAAQRRQERERAQRRLLMLLGGAVVIVVVAAFMVTSGFGLLSSSQSGAASGTADASAVPAEQRNGMYKSAPAMQIDLNKSYSATIETSRGNIVVDLYPKDAPQHVNNFVFLAKQGFYNGLTFHRVEPGFVIQGGDPLGNGTGGPGYTIPPEINRTHSKGALAMARRGGPPQTTPSSGSQFYIALAPLPTLDGQYTVFGQTTADSMPVVEQIRVGDLIKAVTIQEK